MDALGPITYKEKWAVFSFLYLKKIKISKIYVCFGKFQKYTPVVLWGATWLKCIFFFKFATKSLERKKEGACRPPNGRQAPVAHPSGKQMTGKQNQHDLTDKHVLPFYHCNKWRVNKTEHIWWKPQSSWKSVQTTAKKSSKFTKKSYFYISQTKSSLDKIFYKVVYHHIIYMCDFCVKFRWLFLP